MADTKEAKEVAKKEDYPETGLFECEFLGKAKNGKLTYPPKGEKRVYHASTATALAKKGVLKIGKEVKEYFTPTMKK